MINISSVLLGNGTSAYIQLCIYPASMIYDILYVYYRFNVSVLLFSSMLGSQVISVFATIFSTLVYIGRRSALFPYWKEQEYLGCTFLLDMGG